MEKQYITQEGLEKTKNELENLKKVVRRQITDRIEEAIKLGDLSENAEYHEAKEAQGLNEAKIRELEAIIKHAEIIDTNGSNTKVVNVGCSITVKSGQTERDYTIVGSSEADPLKGFISNQSPIGCAFIGHKENEDVEIETPSGVVTYKIMKIK